MIGPTTGIGARPHWFTVQQPEPPVPSSDGGYTQTWLAATPPIWQAAIATATATALERLSAGTTITAATHIITGPYRADLTTLSRLVLGTRVFQIDGVSDADQRCVELVAFCREVPT
jgi:head-tail adaptor